MKKTLSLLLGLFIISVLNAQIQKPNASAKALSDTIVFDILNANYYSNAGSNFIEIPVILKSSNPNINSFDFWFQFNQTELTYVSTTSLVTGLDAFSNFNQANFYLSNTSSGTSINFNIPINVPVVKLTFQLTSACDLINSQDFSNITTLFDGIVSSSKFTAPVPAPIQVTSPLPTCTNNEITFTYDSLYSGKQISDYNWDFGNGATSNIQTDSTHYNSAGNFTITLSMTTTDGCSYTQTLPIDIMVGPIASFTTVQGSSQTEYIFTNTSTFSGGIITTYSWDFGDGTSSTVPNPTHNFPGADTYPVMLTVTADNGCQNSAVANISTIGLEEASMLKLEIYPNPTASKLHVISDRSIEGYEIYDLAGKCIMKGFESGLKAEILIDGLASGQYNLYLKNQPYPFIKN